MPPAGYMLEIGWGCWVSGRAVADFHGGFLSASAVTLGGRRGLRRDAFGR